jgi:hypothetical protein
MKKQTFLEEMNSCLIPYGMCVDYYNPGGNPNYKVMELENGLPVNYFAGREIWRTQKKAELDAFVCGVIRGANRSEEK